MRTKFAAQFAAILVASFFYIACSVDVTTTQIIWLPIGVRTDTLGNCRMTTEIYVDDTTQVGGSGTIVMNVGNTRNLVVRQSMNPSGCRTPHTFRWRSNNPSIASVARLDSITGRVSGVSAGGTRVLAISEQDSSFTLGVDVSVIGTTSPAPTPVSINAEPGADTLLVGGVLALSSNGPYRVRVTYSDGSTRTNNLSLFSSVSSSPSVVSVNDTTRLVRALAPTTGSGVTHTHCIVNTTICDTILFTVYPAPTITFSVTSVCMSTATGSPSTVNVSITTSQGMPTPTVSSSGASIFVVSGPNSSSGQVTTWTLTRIGVGNGNLTATANGVTVSIPVQVISSACPGTTSSINYSPSGGTISTTPITLTATCVVGSGAPACVPYWTSSDPSRIAVQGTTTLVAGGITFWVGMTATLTRVASGTAEICVQWSPTQVSPRTCYTRTAQ